MGKTTLLNLIADTLEPSSGRIIIDATITLMRQEVGAGADATIADVFGVRHALDVLRRAESGNATIDELADAYWTIERRIRAALAQMELDVDATTPLAAISCGQRSRAALAATNFVDVDFMLLDEPTNNLDRAGRDTLIRFVDGWQRGLVAISRDRNLLERMDSIVEQTTLGASCYGGNWSRYRACKTLEIEAAEHDLVHAEKTRAELERKTQVTVERKVRRDAAGSRKAARGDLPAF